MERWSHEEGKSDLQQSAVGGQLEAREGRLVEVREGVMARDVVWNSDGVHIPGVATVDPDFEKIRGTVMYRGEWFIWIAEVTPRGWLVWIRHPFTGRQTSWEGPTFNLVLEVAVAVKNH